MKMILIAYNAAIDDEVMEAIETAGVNSFTKIPEVLGKGHTSEPHFHTDVWPGYNTLLLAVAEDEIVAGVMEVVRNLRTTLGKEGIKAFSVKIEEVT
jgi:nitrogen regulatory protein PII